MRKSYTVNYAYCTKEGNFGIISRKMSLDDIDFMFKSVSVHMCQKWIAPVKSLRRGSSVTINSVEQSESGTVFLKGWNIKKD